MLGEPSFRGAILFSSIFHLLLLAGGGRMVHFESNRVANGIVQQVEVFYSQPTTDTALPQTTHTPEKIITGLSQEVSQQVPPPVTSAKISPEKADLPRVALPPIAANEPRFASQEEEASSEGAIIAGLHLTHEEKPIYLGYYQNIREKIRRSVREHYPRGFQKGQVLLTFVLFSDGKLKEVTTTEKNFFQDRRLKEVVVRSVIETSPFPPFPEGLHRPFVPFRVMITFVNEKSSY